MDYLTSEYDEAFESILEHEGFINVVYEDSEGFDTIGHGIKLPITKAESILIVRYRMAKLMLQLRVLRPKVIYLPIGARNILLEMTYQLGAQGVNKFEKMWKALDVWNFEKASEEMLKSKWHTQTPKRAEALALRMKKLHEES